MSESILLLNPRPRRKVRRTNRRPRRPMTALQRQYFGKKRRRGTNRRRVAHHRRRHRGINPRRRSFRRIARVARRRVRRRFRSVARRARRAGRRASVYGGRIGTQYVIPGVVGAGGALALDIIWGYVSPRLPTQLQSGWAALAAKLGVVVGTAYAIRRF